MIPAEIRGRHELTMGTPLILIDSDDGLVLLTREQMKRRVQQDYRGTGIVDSLLADRRTAAAGEDRRTGAAGEDRR